MTDKEYRKDLAVIHGKLYSIMQAVALLTAKSTPGNYDELLISKFEAVLRKMEDDAKTFAMMYLNELEARDLGNKTE